MSMNLRLSAPLLGLLASACIASAQGSGGLQPGGSVTAALNRFEQDAAAPHAVSSVGWNWSLRLVSRRDPSDSAVVDSVLDGMERLARSAANDRVRARAASFLAVAGKAESNHRPVLPRLIRLYRTSADPVVRVSVIRGMQGQQPEANALAFLKQVATSTPASAHPEFGDEPWEAVTMLAHMGGAGQTALRELRSSATVSDGKARGYLDYVAQRGYVP